MISYINLTLFLALCQTLNASNLFADIFIHIFLSCRPYLLVLHGFLVHHSFSGGGSEEG